MKIFPCRVFPCRVNFPSEKCHYHCRRPGFLYNVDSTWNSTFLMNDRTLGLPAKHWANHCNSASNLFSYNISWVPCFSKIMMSTYTLLSIRRKWLIRPSYLFLLICGPLIFSLIIDLMMDIGWHGYSDMWSCCFKHSKDQSDFSFLKPLLVTIYYNRMSTINNPCCF